MDSATGPGRAAPARPLSVSTLPRISDEAEVGDGPCCDRGRGLEEPFSRPILGLLFDDTDVLYDATIWRRWLLRVLRQLGLRTHYHSFFHVWDQDFLDDVHSGRLSFHEAFRHFLLAVGLTAPQIEEVEAATQGRRTEWEETVRPLPGIRSTLTRLSQSGLKLGVLSDSLYPSTKLNRRFARMGLSGLFSAVVSSQDLGQTKPRAVGYLTAARAMGVAPRHITFVGHCRRELLGAADVGMSTISFNADPDAEADIHVARFEELLFLTQLPLGKQVAA